jgi:hypothetical protein
VLYFQPMVFYEYAGAKGGVNILHHRQLKVTRPRDFNDPFEFSPRLVGSITPEAVRSRFRDPKWVAVQSFAALLRNRFFDRPYHLSQKARKQSHSLPKTTLELEMQVICFPTF